ncbi:MAG: hypothetical protein IJ867_04085 [Clostridia bacterium]|nr:hypothetical protein [Clostridia bacterium]
MEIGGYFELETLKGKEYYDYLAFNSARNCLQFIVKKRNIKQIYIPYYLCLSVKETLEYENVAIIYYHIDSNFMPMIDDYNGKDYVYIVNYFGILKKEQIKSLSEKYKIILDNVHCFFDEGFDNIDTIYSCRKYFGVTDGAYLYSNLSVEEEYKIAKSLSKMNYLIGRYEENSGSQFYNLFVESEDSLIKNDIQLMSKVTHNLLKAIDYNKVKEVRYSNYKYLSEKLNSYNRLELKDRETLFMYPLLSNNGESIRKELISNNIYIPHLWPNLDEFPLNDFEKDIYDNLILLPIDQRYDTNDMDYIYKNIFNILH